MSPPAISSKSIVGSSITGMDRPAVSSLSLEIVPGFASWPVLSAPAMFSLAFVSGE